MAPTTCSFDHMFEPKGREPYRPIRKETDILGLNLYLLTTKVEYDEPECDSCRLMRQQGKTDCS